LNAIVISGSGFDSVNQQNNIVKIGNVLCTITQATSTQLTCSHGLNSIGTYTFTVNVLGSGLAIMDSNPSVTYQLTTTSLSPSSSGVGGILKY
jgi:phosphotransferase system IIA component